MTSLKTDSKRSLSTVKCRVCIWYRPKDSSDDEYKSIGNHAIIKIKPAEEADLVTLLNVQALDVSLRPNHERGANSHCALANYVLWRYPKDITWISGAPKGKTDEDHAKDWRDGTEESEEPPTDYYDWLLKLWSNDTDEVLIRLDMWHYREELRYCLECDETNRWPYSRAKQVLSKYPNLANKVKTMEGFEDPYYENEDQVEKEDE